MHLLIVSPDSYSLFNPATSFRFGGAELRAWKFAIALAEKDVSVSVITTDQGNGVEQFGKVTVYPHPEKKGEGYWKKFRSPVNRVLRNLGVTKSTSSSLEDLLLQLKPDVALILGIGPEAVQLSRYCKKHRIKFVFGCASDMDLDAAFTKGNSGKDRSGNDFSNYYEVYENADIVLVQTPEQEAALKVVFGRNGDLLLNPVKVVQTQNIAAVKTVDLLWVGKEGSKKRPDLFIQLAAMVPHLTCRMIVSGKLSARKLTKNLEVVCDVPFAKMDAHFQAARIFVSTSSVEGFANTFLQAANAGVPIVSMSCDPNKMLSEHHAGVFAGNNIDAVIEAINGLMADTKHCMRLSESGRKYVGSFHDEEKIMSQLHGILSGIYRQGKVSV